MHAYKVSVCCCLAEIPRFTETWITNMLHARLSCMHKCGAFVYASISKLQRLANMFYLVFLFNRAKNTLFSSPSRDVVFFCFVRRRVVSSSMKPVIDELRERE